MAEGVLKKCAPECLSCPQATPVRRIFEDHVLDLYGFMPLVQQMTPGLEGVTDVGAKTIALAEQVYAGLEMDDGRCRFSAGHEIGHAALHRDELAFQTIQLISGSQVRLARRSEIPAYLDPEWQANEFSGCLLMPRRMVGLVVSGVDAAFRAAVVARTFKVSLEAAKIRLRRLNLD